MSTAPSSDHDLLIEIKTLVKALTEIVTGYGKDIRTLDAKVGEHGKRLVVLETRVEVEQAQATRGISTRAVFWTAVSAFVMLSGVVVTVLIAQSH